MQNEYLKKFMKTGKIEDYLKYKEQKSKEDTLNEKSKLKRDSFKKH